MFIILRLLRFPSRAALLAVTALLSLVLPAHSAQVSANQSRAEEVRRMIDSAEEQMKRGQYERSISELKKAVAVAWETQDGYLIISAYRWLGAASLLNGDEAAGQEALDAALRLLKQADDPEETVGTLKAAVLFAGKKNLRATQIRYLRELAEVYSQQSDLKSQADALSQALDLMTFPQDKDLACSILPQLQPIYQKLGDQVGIAASAGGNGRCQELAGDTQAALKDYATAIAGLRQTTAHAELAAALNRTAELLRAHERYNEALPLQKEAVDIRAKLDNQRDYAESLNNLAMLHEGLGNLPLAVEFMEKSLNLTRKVGSKADIATALTNTAAVYRDVGRLDDASALLKDALKIANEEHLDDQAASAMQIMASIHLVQGDPLAAAAAAAVAEDADARARREPESPTFKSHNVGVALIKLGHYDKAIEIFKAELKSAEAAKDEAEIASAHEALAGAYDGEEQYTLAETNLIETEKIYRRLGDPKALSRTLGNLASVYVGMGRYYDALDRYDEVARLSASMHAPIPQIETLLATAEVYRHLKSYDQALDDARRAQELSEKQGFKALAVRAQDAQALVHLHLGNFAEAERILRQKKETGVAKPVINDGLVEVFLATGRFRDAEKELSGVSAETLAGAGVRYQIQYHTQRGIARLGLGNAAQAVDDFNEAVNKVEDLRTQVLGRQNLGFFDAGSYGGRIRPYRGMLEAFATLALAGAKVQITIGDKEYDAPSAAYHFAEEMRSRGLVEKLAWSRGEELSRLVPESVTAEEKQIVDRAKALANQLVEQENRGVATSPAQRQEMEKLTAAAKAHIAAMKKNYPQYAWLFSPSAVPVQELPLSQGEVVLEYGIGLHGIFLFVIGPDHSLRLVRLPVSIEDLKTQVQAFRSLIIAKRFSGRLATNLFRELLGDVVPYRELPERVVIVPDGFLGLLPFEALVPDPGPDGASPSFFGTQHSISYAQSASVLAWTRTFARKQADKPLFALADPIFSTDDPRYKKSPRSPASNQESEKTGKEAVAVSGAGHDWPSSQSFHRLPDTQIEVEKVAAIMGIKAQEPDVLIGSSATKSSLLKTNLGVYRYIHLATHAAALGELGRINEPFLVLGQVDNRNDNDGLLTMSEIMELKLNADLVVLAACDSGGGDVLEGDGVASLASAFQFAGAESVVLSLWELPSEASRSYMENFYGYIKQGRGKAEALRLSRDAMRQQHPDPYYWAVFALYSGSYR